MPRKRFTVTVKRHYLLRANPARAALAAAARAQAVTAAFPAAAVAPVAREEDLEDKLQA